ncbi:MAG: hypothetical protein GTO45_18810 [Candidatus Aminicenantes bacterium]|nr:hypothetical protein [Candidatus Aminicenantes bacterium]NIM80840.1 hypothetical protein [Candidatus Aminicenantes bacterium]NIN20224.1 hypothetical protein [Candidatus Aminicenantes bacterium]NIN44003.1 hypothetical protein [Candidatus Aminicenantes bacterium]NIN86812.1 hypothetical protein [Candidatus Aminicenantes bacterium]
MKMEPDSARWDEIQKILRAKEQFHKDRAKLPIEEKIKILVELQKLAIDMPTASKGNRFRMVWNI